MKALAGLSINRINLYIAHILVFVMPFEQRIVPAVLGLFLFSSLFTCSWQSRKKNFKKRGKYILMLSSLYLLNVLGLLYTENMQQGLFHLEMQFSLFIVPLVVLTGNNINKYTIPELAKTFIASNMVVMMLSFLVALISYLKLGDQRVFYYTKLSLFMHPGYFSMYANFAISLLISLIYHSKNKVNFKYYFGLVVLMVGVYQLASRTGIIILLFNVLYGFGVLVLPRIKFKNQLSAYFLFTGLALSMIGASYFLSNGVQGRLSSTTSEVDNANSSFGSRLAMWRSSIDLVKENPIIGVGSGDAQDVMQAKFKEDRIAYAVVKNLNVHNQFFQVAIAFGLLGVLALLIPMLVPVWHTLLKGKYLYLLFIGNVSINFLTESVLEKQGGVIFYAITWVFLYFTWND